jgi:UDP-N-acetylglucosamine:LPS N-acetylglucosamine transferase
MILIHMLPGQEEGNVAFVEEHKAGVFCETSQDAEKTLEKWLDDQGKILQEIGKNAEKIGRPEAAGQIAEKAWDLIN